jgi:hypothetical protein
VSLLLGRYVMSRKWLSVALGAGLLLVTTACNGDDEAGGSTTTEATTTTSTTTTTTVPTTTTVAVIGPAPWNEIVADLYERTWDLAANPNPDAVRLVYSEDCDCYATFLQGAQDLVANGLHYTGEPPRPLAVMTSGQGGGGFQTVVVRVDIPVRQVADSNGAVVQEFAAQTNVCESLLLQPSGPGGTYRIHDFFLPQRCPEGL